MTNGNSAERERFEAAGITSRLSRCTEPGYEAEYSDPHTQFAWKGWQAALSVCADGGKGDAALQRLTAEQERLGLYVMNIPLDAAATMADYAPQAECAPREAQPVEDMKISVVTEDKSPLEVKSIHYFAREIIVRVTAPQAECAPREAQPVAHFIYDKDDDLWEQVRGEFASDADVVPLFRRSSPESAKQGDFAAFCEHYIDASEDVNREWLFNIVSKWVQWNAAPTPERADAKKDAALTNEKIEAAIEAWFDTDGKDVDDHQSRMRAAILAANKEPQP